MKMTAIRIISFLILLFPTTSQAAEVFYYSTDNVGTPVAMWDKNGKKVWEGEYYPFGEEYQVSESPKKNDKRFIGKEKDKETGLTSIGSRYYDEGSGRFISPDPVRPVDAFTSKTNYTMLGNPQRLNQYAYGLNNPYRYVDPDGEFPESWSEAGQIVVDNFKATPGRIAQKTKNAFYWPKNHPKEVMMFMLAGELSALEAATSKGTTTLYRAVSKAEFKQIQKTGTFEAGPNSLGGKFFAESVEDAQKWGDVLNGSGKSRIVGAEMPKGAADSLQRWERIDGIGPARYGELDQLKDVTIKEVRQ